MPDAMMERAPVASISFPVVTGLARLLDLLLLGLAGVVSVSIVTSVYGAAPQGEVLLAALIGTAATALFIAREEGYTQSALSTPGHAVRLLIKPLVLGTFCVIASLFLSYESRLPFRIWPVVWAVCAASLVVAGRLPLARLMRHWAR